MVVYVQSFNLTQDGHTTEERPHLKAVQVIEHYNWVWKNMIPTKGTVNVRPHQVILDGLLTTIKQNIKLGALSAAVAAVHFFNLTQDDENYLF